MPGLIDLELVDPFTGEVIPLGDLPKPESPAAVCKLVRQLRDLGVTAIEPDLAESLGLPVGYRMVGDWQPASKLALKALALAQANRALAERSAANEAAHGPLPFGQQIDGQGRRKRAPNERRLPASELPS